MRVLTLTHELPPIGGGGGRIALELARRMAGLGHEVDVLTAGYGDLPAAEEADGIRILRVPCRRKQLSHSTDVEKLTFVRAAARELGWLQSYDLIHAHFILPAGLVARRGRAPYLITCHGSDVPGHNPFEGRLEHALLRPWWQDIVRRAGAVVSPSRNLQELILAAAPASAPRLHQIPNGYPCGKFAETSRQGGILLVSRLIELKGFQYFLQGLAGVELGHPVHIVGDGPLRQELETLADQTPTEVIFHGWLDNDSAELKALMESAAIFVFPSEAENFPTVLLEAMDAGQAIVTTNVKGCPEVVGETGLTVPPRSPEALREAVQALLDAPQRAGALGRAARARVRAEFDWSVVQERYQRLYELVAHG